jgi:hypothetical protein
MDARAIGRLYDGAHDDALIVHPLALHVDQVLAKRDRGGLPRLRAHVMEADDLVRVTYLQV